MQDIIGLAISSVSSRKDSHLILPLRKKLWLAFGPVEMESDNKAKKTNAYKARVKLALVACKRVLPIWEEVFPNSDVASRCLRTAEEYMNGRRTFEDARKIANMLAGALENVSGMSKQELNALLVGHACNDALFITLGDCCCDDIDELDENLDSWDCSMYAAGAYAGGYPFNEGEFASDPNKLREFWIWYLKEAGKLMGNVV